MNLTQIDSQSPKANQDEILLFAVIRNECLRLPYFMEYHRRLGVNRFYIVDNDSTDDSAAYLLKQPDCHVFHGVGSYAASRRGKDWINSLLLRYGTGHWVVVLDPDELLVYPDCEQQPLQKLTRRMQKQGIRALQTFMLDMYSNKPITQTDYMAGEPFINACPFFDRDSYQYSNTHYLLSRVPLIGQRLSQILGKAVPKRGGARARVFWSGEAVPGTAPYLKKTPLLQWQSDFYFVDSHVVRGVNRRNTGLMTGVLLHFKFFQDFIDKALLEAKRKEYWNNAAEYQVYAKAVLQHPDLCLHYQGSVKYSNSQQLVQMGFMHEDSY